MIESIKGPIYEHKLTKELLRYLPNKSIVFLWHEDLDGVAVDGLIHAKVKAVINGNVSMSGQYSHNHVKRLIDSGIAVFDIVHLERMHEKYDGEEVVIVQNKLYVAGKDGMSIVASLLPYTLKLVNHKLAVAEMNYSSKFVHFLENTLTYAKNESEWFRSNPQFPQSLNGINDKEVFIVARNTSYELDIRAVCRSLQRRDMIVIAVDGAADGLLRQQIIPDFIIGDMDSVSEDALRCGAILLCHERPNGDSPGKERVMKLGVSSETIRFIGTSEDVAIAAAYWSNAAHLYLIGCRMGMTEFLEKNREGMGATWLCRMQAGERITDLKGIHKMMSPSYSPMLHHLNSFQFTHWLKESLLPFIADRIPFVKKKEAFRHD